MASDDDLIYVDVVPRLDEAEAEKATGRLRDKLKDGVKGAGKAVSDVFHSELAEELGRSIGPIAHDMGVELGKKLGSKAGDFLHEQISDALKGVGVDFDDIIDKAHELADEFGVDADSVGKLADAFKAAKAGDQAKAFDDLADALQKVPGPIGEVAGTSKGLLDTYSGLKSNVKDVSGLLTTFEKDAPGIAGALGTVGAAAESVAGPLAAAATAAMEIDKALHIDSNTFDPGQHGWGHVLFGKIPDWLGITDPSTGLDKHLTPKTDSPITSKPGVPIVPTPGSTPASPPGYTASPGSLDPFSALLPPGVKSPAGGGIPPIAPPDMGGIPAHTSGASVPLMQNPDGTITSSNPSWAHLIARESSGRNVRQGIHDINSGGNEAEGYFQITPRTWAAHGGTQFAPSPLAATPQQQAAIAARILQSNPSGSDWGAGLPGRESAGALLGGLGAAPAAITPGGPIRATLADYTRPAGTGLGMRPAGFGIPPDIPGLPGLGPQGVPGTIPGQFGPQGIGSPPNLDQTHTYSQKQQQQLGSGQGFGLTGGGLIGLLEQLPGMAASAAGGASSMFGGGAAGGAAAAAWSDIAVPEINLAAQKGGQMIAAAAEAPLETFGLTGGQMGAPSVNPQSGWIGKILGSMLGSQFSMPNIAGSVQPPKQGGDKDSSGQGDDSSPGGKSQQEQAGGGGAAAGGGKPGPTGHKDDPIHVQQVPQPGGHPQGQATSAMNTTGVASAMTA